MQTDSNRGLAEGSLAGIRVLDLTRVIAGPLATQILGDLGADVIKVERPDGGDDIRRVGPPWMTSGSGEGELSTYYQAINRNKRSVTLSFETAEGRSLLRDLAMRSDVLVENFRPGTLSRYGLGYDDLKKVHPGLIYCSVSGFGQSGPYSGRSGYDYLAQGMTGLMNVTGHPDDQPGGGPMRVGIPLVDIFAGMNAAMGVLAALRHRAEGGGGQQVDISLFDSGIAAMLNPVAAWFNSGIEIGLTSNDHPSAAPYGIFEVDDGHIIIATFSDRDFGRLAPVLGHPEWLEDPRFARNGARVQNRTELKARITEALRGRGKKEWIERLNAENISSGPINSMEDLAGDPHLIARGSVQALDHPVLGRIFSAASPLRLSGSPVSYRIAPPLQGEHTDQVLSEVLNLAASDIEQLRTKGVLA